ncbi:Farnesyl diphosphate synthase [Pseudobythopirellula maris]|uniref:Farnesyl diphosphate synthase n=1 Tax=Pseudobythopirellula maris TaxID=2527991 RepID=A0A5C5ZIH1_9BACT|nr:farnesyl diphosphate synthase [Pseudobythopirellula maris]TWT86915.1 Farnesyl diphosphate synthase [Pseudobythopirellula maris]
MPLPSPSAAVDHAAPFPTVGDDPHGAIIEAALQRCLPGEDRCPPLLAEALRYTVLGPGKRLRPRLVLMAAEACGGDAPAALPAACAVELIHAYSLAHDDLPAMDDDDLRRGRPTCHKRFDEATAVLAGDALQPLAFELLAGLSPADTAARCCAELARAAGAEALVGGQVDDLAGAEALVETQQLRQRLERIHARKTGAMITVSLRLGAIVAGASQEILSTLTAFGERLGLLFQVTDDLLDATGDAEEVGKRTGKDEGRGKLTYPVLMGVEATREFADRTAAEALQSLEPLDATADPLRALVDKVHHRSH